jgi:outer membrane protein assembly factor BamB
MALLLALVRFGTPAVAPGFEGFGVAVLGGLLGTLIIVVWWAFFSRAPGVERWGAPLLMVIAVAATWRLNHESMRLMWCVYYAAAWTLVRMEGLTGDHVFQFAWRWTETHEDQLLAEAGTRPPPPPSTPVESTVSASWPGFRGPHRDGVVPGVRIETDWSGSPPVELWRKPVGPGWSSFAVGGDLLYTQEQRGDAEVVACHHSITGETVWLHADPVRFFEAMGGAGPRATPALSEGRVYALGATGILNVLSAPDGAVVWSRDVAADTGTEVPIWGFASSPLVTGDLVMVAAGGRLVACDRATGDPRWTGDDGGPSYSSPHSVRLGGLEQILLLSGAGATSVALDGTPLWEYAWPGSPLIQPALIGDDDLLISAGEGKGLRRIAVERGSDGWTATERWESNRMKPNFNDLVVHRGHAYGFDGSILACIDLEGGERRWKGGRYGHGQLLLLPDQDLLLVVTERGELALVTAASDRFTELARFKAIEGKTWNHPVLVGDLVLVRNGEEMAAFRMPLHR